MKYKRIFKPEQMNEKDKETMSAALDSFYKKHYRYETDEEIEARREADPNLVKIDGKWYHKDFLNKKK